MEKLYFDTYRLGQVQRDMGKTEADRPKRRHTFLDLTAIRRSNAPGNGKATPKACCRRRGLQIVRYAGLSDKLSSFGLYELNPAFDEHGQTAHLAAQMIWYLTEGYYNRKKTSRSRARPIL